MRRTPRPAFGRGGLGLLALHALLLAGCSARQGGEATHASSAPAAAPEARAGGTLVVYQERPTTLDPLASIDVYSCTIARQLFVGLLRFGANLDPTPALAMTWTISPDGLTHTFDLHPGARFHDGRPVTAADAAYSLQRAFAPDGPANVAAHYLASLEGSEEFRRGRASSISGLRVLGPTRLQIRLVRRDPSFLWALCLPQASVVCREELEARGAAAFARHPVGSGPFRLAEWTADRVVLVANRDFFGKAARVDSLVFQTPAKRSTEIGAQALLRGEAHFAEVRQEHYRQVMEQPRLRVLRRRELALAFLGVNRRIPPLDRPGVREALAHAIPRLQMVKMDSLGAVLPSGVLPPGMQGYTPSQKSPAFDPELAARRLAEAGFPAGRGLAPVDLWTSHRSATARRVDSVMVSALERVGLRVRVHEEEWRDLSRRIDERRAALFSLSWIADTPDPDSFLGSLFDSGSPSNLFGYASTAVDSLLRLARINPDPFERGRQFQEAEARVLADVALVPLYHRASLYGVAAGVHGIDLTPLGISVFDFSQVWIEDPRRAL